LRWALETGEGVFTTGLVLQQQLQVTSACHFAHSWVLSCHGVCLEDPLTQSEGLW